MAITLQGNGLSTFSNAITSTSGNLSLGDGDLVVAQNHGVDFSATANSSGTMSSELLDDYEEGTFVPYFAVSATGMNIVSAYDGNGRVGFYTKIGRVVNFYLNVLTRSTADGGWQFENGGGGATGLFIRGLPYTVTSTNFHYGGVVENGRYVKGGWTGYTNYGLPQMNTDAIRWMFAQGGTNSISGDVQQQYIGLAGSYISCWGQYITD